MWVVELSFVAVRQQSHFLKNQQAICCLGEIMVLGDIIFEGKGKSNGPSYIKSISAEGVESMFAWTAQLKGMGKAKGIDATVNVTATSITPPKGVAASKDKAMLFTMAGDMAVVRGLDLMKMVPGANPSSVGLWTFMTMSEKLGWLNEVIALVTFEATDPMWMEFNVTITEWK